MKITAVILGSVLICSVFGRPDPWYEAGRDEKMLAKEVQLPGLCDTCKWIVEKVRKVLPDDAGQEKIREQLETVCNKTGPLKYKCVKFVRNHITKLMKEIASADDANTACVYLKACK